MSGVVREGLRSGIPLCCCLRFAWTWGRPGVLRRFEWWRRAKHLTPRWAYAFRYGEGYVPCEYHLLRWVVTGERPVIRQD